MGWVLLLLLVILFVIDDPDWLQRESVTGVHNYAHDKPTYVPKWHSRSDDVLEIVGSEMVQQLGNENALEATYREWAEAHADYLDHRAELNKRAEDCCEDADYFLYDDICRVDELRDDAAEKFVALVKLASGWE